MLEARKASYLKVVAATMKPPARPDKPAESTQPVQPALAVQTSKPEQQAKPVQPVQPVVQANQQAQPTTSTKSSPRTSPHMSPHVSPLPINKFNSPRHSSPAVSNGIINSHSSVSKEIKAGIIRDDTM